MRWLLTVLIAIAMLLAPTAKADPVAQCNVPCVYVDPGIDNSALVADRIARRLQPGDNILVTVFVGNNTPGGTIGSDVIFLLAQGNKVTPMTFASWPPQNVLNIELARVNNVASDSVDRILLMIKEIHAWQAANPKPVPPPPPTPPMHINWWIVGPSIAVALLGIFLIIQAIRRHIKAKRLGYNYDHKVGWTVSNDIK